MTHTPALPTELLTEHWHDIERDKRELQNELAQVRYDLKTATKALDYCETVLQWWVNCEDDSSFMERAIGAIHQANR